MPDEDNNFDGSLVSHFRKWWRHVQPKNISLFDADGINARIVIGQKPWLINLTSIFLTVFEKRGISQSFLGFWLWLRSQIFEGELRS